MSYTREKVMEALGFFRAWLKNPDLYTCAKVLGSINILLFFWAFIREKLRARLKASLSEAITGGEYLPTSDGALFYR
jgi:hypothetical protein